MGRSGLLLDLLHAHRVSHLWLCHSMLNLFAIRICSFCSLHPSANPPNHHYNVSRPTTQNKTPDNRCYLVFYMESKLQHSNFLLLINDFLEELKSQELRSTLSEYEMLKINFT